MFAAPLQSHSNNEIFEDKADQIRDLTARLSTEIEQKECLQAALRIANAEREKAETLLDELMQAQSTVPNPIAAEWYAERERRLRAEQENQVLQKDLRVKVRSGT